MNNTLNLVPRFRLRKADQVIIPTNFSESAIEPTMVDHHNPAIKVILQGEEISGCIIEGGSGFNVISKATCNCLGIAKWEACPFWLRMADTRSICPLRLLHKLAIVIGGHMFEIVAVVLLGRPWLTRREHSP